MEEQRQQPVIQRFGREFVLLGDAAVKAALVYNIWIAHTETKYVWRTANKGETEACERWTVYYKCKSDGVSVLCWVFDSAQPAREFLARAVKELSMLA